MWKSFLLLIFQGISGGVAGYITNKYAVNMLFKEYTPLKLGGVIKKKKEKFIDEISDLVERDIINSETLKAEIVNKNFDNYIEQIAENFFEKGLAESLGKTKLKEIADFSISAEKSESFVKENLNTVVPELLESIFINVKLEDILTENQISKIVNSGYDLLVEELENDKSLDMLLFNFYEENSNITLAEILSEEVREKFINNITERISEIVREEILADQEGLRIFLDKILSVINVDVTLVKLQGLIGDYEINQFITSSEKEEFTLKLFDKVNEFINSERGKELVIKLSEEILLIGKDIDFTIYEILPPEMEKSLTNFIETVIPKVMPYVSEWISGNKDNFDEMIEASIDEAISDMDDNIKKLVISKVRSALMGDISSKNNVVNKIITYMNDSFDEDSYAKLADSIIEYLKSKKIKDIIELLENKNLFNSNKLAELIIKEFRAHGKELLATILKIQFSKKIHKVFDFDLVKLFNNKLKPILYNKIFDNKDKMEERMNYLIKDFISLKGKEVFNNKLSELFVKEQVHSFSNMFAKFANKFLASNSSLYKPAIKELLSKQIKSINLSNTLEKYKVNISEYIVNNSVIVFKDTVDKYKEYEVKEVASTHITKDTLAKLLIDKGYPKLVEKLPSILDGNIKKFARNNLRKYNEDEICDIVQDFMGDQLKPLSVFGAILGVVVGVGYQLIYPNSVGAYGFPGGLLDTIMSCGVMAFIGYITNVVALWMIFHPYKENKVVAKIPFFKKFALGYIPAHKNQFASGMAKLIDDELLNKEEINRVFKVRNNNMKSVLMMLVTNNDYQILVDLLRDKKQTAAKYVYERILKYCNKDSYLSKRISNSILNNKFDQFIKKDNFLKVVQNLIGKVNSIKNNLVEYINKKLSDTNKVHDILPVGVYDGIEKYIDIQTSTLLDEKYEKIKNIDFISKIVKEYYGEYDLIINKSAKEIFSEETLTDTKNNIEIKIEAYFSNNLKTDISTFVKRFLESGLDENNTIGSMFDGKIKRIIDENLYLLTTKIANKLIIYVQQNEYEIALSVQEAIQNELNFFEKIAYGAFGGDEIASRAVSIMLKEKLPVMIKAESDKLVQVAQNTLNNSIYEMKTSTLKIKADEINTAMLFDNAFDKFSGNSLIREHISKAGDFILTSLFAVPIVEYLELCNLNNLELVYKKFYNEINIIKEDIYSNIKANKDNLSETLSGFVNEKITKALFESYNSKIFEGITSADVEYSLNNISNIISSSQVVENYISMFLEKVYDNKLSNMEFKEILDENILINDFEKIIKVLFENESINEKNIILIEGIIQNSVDRNFDFLEQDTKDYLTDKTIQAGLYSISDYIIPILQEVNLKNITNKQIELLNPKEIDILFKSFAGDFFKKLEIYGVWGFVFGINAGLSLVLWALDYRYGKISAKKELRASEEV
ncbi:DUF445 family protein [Clostridium sp. C2-6-12]|uniref:DUF445 family protein n=1 Tax=Clostridium sp. C2-6-12 TaxID=2698832 RepID=UPI00136EC6C3|nr:DUF445 family protein [Clostridium sp. C2-6-12]